MHARPYGIEATLAALAQDRAALFLRLCALHGYGKAYSMMFWPGKHDR